MKITDCTWDQFKKEIETQIQSESRYIYRGQSDSEWSLKTSLHRTGQWPRPKDIVSYMEKIVPVAYETVATWDGIKRDLKNPFINAQFIALLQHHGFPTPLLDWTYSPYIAGYFAFEGIDHFEPQYEYVSIYAFDKELWLKSYEQSYDYKDENLHVSVLEPSIVGNPKQMLQQGIYMYTNQVDIEGHIESHVRNNVDFIKKYRIKSSEQTNVLRELNYMNINRMLLFPSLEGACKKLAIDVSLIFPMGKSKSEIRNQKFINAISGLSSDQQET